MNAIPHPTVPLHRELTSAILAAHTQPEVDAILQQFKRRRDQEFPGWMESHRKQVEEWMQGQK